MYTNPDARGPSAAHPTPTESRLKEILEILDFELEDMKKLTANGYSVTGWGLQVPL